MEICDLCWDDCKEEVPSYVIVAGVPLCAKHAKSTEQERFEETDPDEEIVPAPVVKKSIPKQTPQKQFIEREREKMAEEKKEIVVTPPIVFDEASPRSSQVAKRGITTGAQFSQFMAALMTDLVNGKIEPNVASAACTAGGKLLQMVEMQMKHRTNGRILRLTEGNSE